MVLSPHAANPELPQNSQNGLRVHHFTRQFETFSHDQQTHPRARLLSLYAARARYISTMTHTRGRICVQKLDRDLHCSLCPQVEAHTDQRISTMTSICVCVWWCPTQQQMLARLVWPSCIPQLQECTYEPLARQQWKKVAFVNVNCYFGAERLWPILSQNLHRLQETRVNLRYLCAPVFPQTFASGLFQNRTGNPSIVTSPVTVHHVNYVIVHVYNVHCTLYTCNSIMWEWTEHVNVFTCMHLLNTAFTSSVNQK